MPAGWIYKLDNKAVDGNEVEMVAGNSESTGNNEVAGHLSHPGASDYNHMLQLG